MHLIPILKAGIWNAWIYMSVFIIQMFIIMFAGEQVKRRSHVPDEARLNRAEKNISVIANIVWLAALLYSVFLPLKIGTILFFAGLLTFAIGLIILTAATCYFLSVPPDQLISKGVYRFSRHPMYLATFLICLGAGISSGSWIFIILSIVMIYCFHREALVEERFCLNRYGKTYQQYMNHVPRWIGLRKRKKDYKSDSLEA